ncbi:hypothetical protein GCM10009775_22210 [Microbacterium aoyamense]|uniref:SnoaL-like domain-containing protein n=1 Tax=Microbacterium aoyamense TaxID=344166 RepID=A0ABN2PR54_9MICO|nr:nuclear transport factor 2 family protein [Microbacterium aoyamense]
MTNTVSELLAANLHEVFGNRDVVTRRAAIDRIYSEDVVFTDPEGSVHGRAAVEEKAAALLDGVPGDFVFTEDSERYASADTGALAWAFGPTTAPVARGIDVITVDGATISRVHTLFIDTPRS